MLLHWLQGFFIYIYQIRCFPSSTVFTDDLYFVRGEDNTLSQQILHKMKRRQLKQVPIEASHHISLTLDDLLIGDSHLLGDQLLKFPYQRDVVVQLIELGRQQEARDCQYFLLYLVKKLGVLDQDVQVHNCQVDCKGSLLQLFPHLKYVVNQPSSSLYQKYKKPKIHLPSRVPR